VDRFALTLRAGSMMSGMVKPQRATRRAKRQAEPMPTRTLGIPNGRTSVSCRSSIPFVFLADRMDTFLDRLDARLSRVEALINEIEPPA
jgi:hypothetical protein